MEVTENFLLDGKVVLNQPKQGYRVAIDPVLLAAAVPALSKQSILDVGAGVGGATLCLANRIADCTLTGLEVVDELARVGNDNIASNSYDSRAQIIQGSLLNPPASLKPQSYDHVMTNPPFMSLEHSVASQNQNKALAHHEMEVDLQTWLQFCIKMAKPKATVTLIHRADRLDEILTHISPHLGGITLFPLWPKQGKEAKRIIVQGCKGSKAPLKLHSGLILHQPDGGFTPEADRILRDGGSLGKEL